MRSSVWPKTKDVLRWAGPRALRAMRDSELGLDRTASILGTDARFIQAVIEGDAQITSAHVRRIEKQTGKSVGHWALLSMDRGKMNAKQRDFHDSTLELFKTFDRARESIDQMEDAPPKPRPKRRARKATAQRYSSRPKRK